MKKCKVRNIKKVRRKYVTMAYDKIVRYYAVTKKYFWRIIK